MQGTGDDKTTLEIRSSTENHEREGCGRGARLPELRVRSCYLFTPKKVRSGRVDPRSGSEARRRLPESEPAFTRGRALVEEQDAAVPFRVRVDVAAWRAGGDAFALTSC